MIERKTLMVASVNHWLVHGTFSNELVKEFRQNQFTIYPLKVFLVSLEMRSNDCFDFAVLELFITKYIAFSFR